MQEIEYKVLNEETLTSKDLRSMITIERSTPIEIVFSGDDLLDLVCDDELFCLAAYIDKSLVGYMFLSRDYYEEDDIYIYNFMVHPEFRGQGVGKELFREVYKQYMFSADAESVTLDVEKENSAIYLYQKLGFKIENIDSKNGSDNFVMKASVEDLGNQLDAIFNEPVMEK